MNDKVIIAQKNGELGMVSMVPVGAAVVIGSVDEGEKPKQTALLHPDYAQRMLNDTKDATLKNGWAILYEGPPLFG